MVLSVRRGFLHACISSTFIFRPNQEQTGMPQVQFLPEGLKSCILRNFAASQVEINILNLHSKYVHLQNRSTFVQSRAIPKIINPDVSECRLVISAESCFRFRPRLRVYVCQHDVSCVHLSVALKQAKLKMLLFHYLYEDKSEIMILINNFNQLIK